MTEEEIFHTFTETKEKMFNLLDLLKFRRIKFNRLHVHVNKKFKSLINPKPNTDNLDSVNDSERDDVVITDLYYSTIKA